MLSLKFGEIACFEPDQWGRFDSNHLVKDIYRTGPDLGGIKHLVIQAHPLVPVRGGAELEIMLFKLAGGAARFVYSEARESQAIAGTNLVETKLYLQQAPWGGGRYRIDLLADNKVIARGPIKIS